MGQYIVENGEKRFQFDDNSKVDVVAILNLDNGLNSRLVAEQQQLLAGILTELETLNAGSASKLQRIQAADDYTLNYTYLDAGNPIDERIETVSYGSTSLNLTVTDTYQYSGSAGSYRLTSITRT